MSEQNSTESSDRIPATPSKHARTGDSNDKEMGLPDKQSTIQESEDDVNKLQGTDSQKKQIGLQGPSPADVEKEADIDSDATPDDSGRERLKRHRKEVAGRVWIPEKWGKEELLKDWIDCSAFTASLVPSGIMLARAALIKEEPRANSGGLSIENRSMAVSSTTATSCIAWRDPNGLQYSTPKLGFPLPHAVRFPVKQQQRNYLMRSSSSDASQETATETDSQSSVEESKSPPSLISALNVEKALRGIAITDADHYGRLGLQRGCPYEEVTVAYKNKYEELMNQGLDEEDPTEKVDLLKESYSILSSEEERRLYDWSLARAEKTDRYVWPFEVDITQTPTQSPPPQEPEDVGPTRVVGYFILGWLVLSFALSIALNR